jgi:bifunctional non-homologous end joining protein LigD
MGKKLLEYNKKRNFEQTKEPSGKVAKGDTAKKLRFVIQRHHASRLHYDFRLELNGVLKSWAVPKGPSLNPKDKRLAVQVEDHPVSYASFEGEIPQGNYGAGTVSIFDQGYYDFIDKDTPADFRKGLKNGSLKFVLHGKKLKGEFALVRINNEDNKSWLLIKHRDRYATDEAYDSEDLVTDSVKNIGANFKKKNTTKRTGKQRKANETAEDFSVKPMLAKLVDTLPTEDGWIYEKKYDGFRIIAQKEGKEVRLYSRNGKLMNTLFPSLATELQAIDPDVVLDGELVIEDLHGIPQFQLLQCGEPVAPKMRLCYYVFDLLRLENADVRKYILKERRELLRLLLKKIGNQQIIKGVETLSDEGSALLQKAKEEHWEGIMAKDSGSTYISGKRSSSWVKYKLQQSQEAIICGFTAPQGNRDFFGALVLGVMDGKSLRYIGNCGTGYSDQTLNEIYAKLHPLTTSKKPFAKDSKIAKEKSVTWVKPKLVCEVYFSEWTKDARLRHPVFKGLRTDKEAADIQVETRGEISIRDQVISVGRKKVQLTNLNKIYWPKENYLKGQMVAYYDEFAPYILPFLKDKPISMHRFPNGIATPSFFQKDVDPQKMPEWMRTEQVYSESTDKYIDYLLCNDKASLLYIANLGSIEINPWLSTYKKQDYPDFAVLDLDPNGTDFQTVVNIALAAHDILQQIGLPSFVKTSGSTGLHIYLYTKRKYTYDVTRDFVQWLAQALHEMFPDDTSVIRDPRQRKGLV